MNIVISTDHRSLPWAAKCFQIKDQIESLEYTHILLLDGALLTIIGVGDSRASTDHTAPLIGAIVTLITYAHQGAGTHVGITDHTLAIACE